MTTTLAEADATYNTTMTIELDNIRAMVDASNATVYEDLDNLHEHYCTKINSAGTFTNDLISTMKSNLAAKIDKLVKTVQYEMKHSRRQISLLRANAFF